MEQWNSGTVELWNSGTVELWNCGVVAERPSRKLSPIPASLGRYAADLLRPDREKSSIMELISIRATRRGGRVFGKGKLGYLRSYLGAGLSFWLE